MIPPRETLFLPAPGLSEELGLDVALACETFQHTGSFKFRAARNVASRIPHPRLIAASSGNFGQAIARACRLAGKGCTVVMPAAASKVKIAAVKREGARVEIVDTTRTTRAERVKELAAGDPEAYVASAYDDPLVIEGNATLGREIAARVPAFDAVIAPVGGGGLLSGIVTGAIESRGGIAFFGAEPSLANDAARSLAEGRIVALDSEPATIADGARTLSLGRHNFPILREHVRAIVEVPEAAIAGALAWLFASLNLKAEPTGALAVGALRERPDLFRGRRVCAVVSGGNVDADLYARLITA